jgi:CBS domain containing-hemolysin-like protein
VWFADLQAPGTGIADPAGPTEDELRRLTSEAAATGTIERSDHVLVDRAFELGDLRVDDVYVPRLDIVAVPGTASVRAALDLAVATGHRRIPVYEGDIDNIVGVVRLRDLARVGLDHPEKPVSIVAVEPIIVPESRKVVDLLGDMRDKAIHFAVVVDEFGGTAGIVTIEDVVERLVGPIAPIGGTDSDDIQAVGSTTWIVVGTADTDEIERAIGRTLPRGEWNTVAGLVIALIGHFPRIGETAETEELTFTVLEESSHRILRIRIETR